MEIQTFSAPKAFDLSTLDPKTLQVLRNQYAKGLSDEELAAGLTIANRYGLDPFAGEIYFVKGMRPIVSRDGYLAIAQRRPNFDGLASGVVRKKDAYKPLLTDGTLAHEPHLEDDDLKTNPIIGAWAVAYAKDRRPSLEYVRFEEYNVPNKDTWRKYPSSMITKVAEIRALKKQFGINGVAGEEEMDRESNEPKTVAKEDYRKKPATPKKKKEEVIQTDSEEITYAISDDLAYKVKEACMEYFKAIPDNEKYLASPQSSTNVCIQKCLDGDTTKNITNINEDEAYAVIGIMEEKLADQLQKVADMFDGEVMSTNAQ